MKRGLTSLAAVFLCLVSFQVHGQDFTGKCVSIADGDTVGDMHLAPEENCDVANQRR